MVDVGDAIRRFSKTPLKHRMSKYLLEYLLENTELLNKIRIVNTRAYLPDTMMIAQAGVEGLPFELELGAVERDEVSIINGRLVKQKRKNRAIWITDPVQAVEVLANSTESSMWSSGSQARSPNGTGKSWPNSRLSAPWNRRSPS